MNHLRLSANTKRQRMNIFDDAHFDASPATAALEESLAKDTHATFDLDANFSLLSACVPEFPFSELESHPIPCKYHDSLRRPGYSAVNDVSHILARMTTSA